MWTKIKSWFCRTRHNTKNLFKPGFAVMFVSAVANDTSMVKRSESVAIRILENKSRYINVARQFGMPWEVVGVIHYLEGNLDFTRILHNGERLPVHATKLVPKGRGPFSTWEQAARDAISIEHARPSKWTINETIDWLERYNGLGYRKRSINSPYLWSGTQYYKKGKYSSDGRYKRYLVSKQVGAVLILKALGYKK